MKPVKLMTILTIALIAAYLILSGRSTTVGADKSTSQFEYFVWGVEILSDAHYEGRSFRFAQLASISKFHVDQTNPLELAEEIQVDGVEGSFTNPLRAGQGDSPADISDLAQPVGFIRVIERPPANFYNLFSKHPVTFVSLTPVAGQPRIKYKLHLLKRCPVRLEIAEKRQLGRGKTNGVIVLPTLAAHKVAEVSKPDCYEESDRLNLQ